VGEWESLRDSASMLQATRTGSDVKLDIRGARLDDLLRVLSPMLQRRMLSATGIAGLFDFQIEYSNPAGSDPMTDLSAALER
jgi:hypothetical protein